MEQKLVPGSPISFVHPHRLAGYLGILEGYSYDGSYALVGHIGGNEKSFIEYSHPNYVRLSFRIPQQLSREKRPWSDGPWQPTEEGIVQAEATLLYNMIKGDLKR